MDTIFRNSESSKTSEPHRLLLNLADKINLKRSDMLLYHILVCTTHGKISASKWNENFDLADISYSVLDIQDYFEYILKNTEFSLFFD